MRPAVAPDDLAAVRELFTEYVTWLAIDLDFQGFANELATLPGKYAEPGGRLLVAEASDGRLAGCVAVRALPAPAGEGAACELKRLWVRPSHRHLGLGHALTAAALDAAREMGYRRIKLDTLPHIMPNAVAMYRSFGFDECEPYYRNPIEGTLYMELLL